MVLESRPHPSSVDIDARLAALVVVKREDAHLLGATLRDLLGRAVIPSLHVCVMTDQPQLKEDIQQTTDGLAEAHSSSVDVVAGNADLREMRSEERRVGKECRL